MASYEPDIAIHYSAVRRPHGVRPGLPARQPPRRGGRAERRRDPCGPSGSRPDLTWHDGKPVTADDVVYSFQRIVDPKTPADRRRRLWAGSTPSDSRQDRRHDDRVPSRRAERASCRKASPTAATSLVPVGLRPQEARRLRSLQAHRLQARRAVRRSRRSPTTGAAARTSTSSRSSTSPTTRRASTR